MKCSATVSIPFKRESLSKDVRSDHNQRSGKRFQFPSNGKVYPKTRSGTQLTMKHKGFNSLQTGKPIQSERASEVEKILIRMFQFPSNGKAYPKVLEGEKRCEKIWVSIPFKRESLSKVDRYDAYIKLLEFQFPSNGKAYPKTQPLISLRNCSIKFQFPSNGKAYPKTHKNAGCIYFKNLPGFNSLQTGKPIQRRR